MAMLVWDDTGNQIYETGTDRGVLYPINSSGAYPAGVAWDGLRSVTESPSGAEETALWANNHKYGSLYSAEEFGFTIGAYTSPEEFDACDGTAEIATGVTIAQQNRTKFGMSYRTLIGNDVAGTDYGYKIHLVYGATASPSERSHSTVPVAVAGFKPSAHMVIDSTKADADKLAALEAILYGSDATVYIPTSDTSKQDGKSYFTRSGEEGNYTYTAFTGSSFSSGVTYYEAVTAGPRLPLPSEVITLMG